MSSALVLLLKSLPATVHVGFDRPEAWALKYYTSATLLSGLQPAEPSEGHRIGSINFGFEVGWLPRLNADQRRVGFNGKAVQDLNKAAVLLRPVIRIGLPGRFSFVAAAPLPFRTFEVTPHLFAFGLERPLWEGKQWTLSWRGSGQVGTVKGAITCPRGVASFAPGSAENSGFCVGESADVATLRYAGTEFQIAYRIPRAPRVVPHAAVGGNFIDAAFQVHAPTTRALDRTRYWTRGGTFSSSWGVSFLLPRRTAFTVDAFYSPLGVQRSPTAKRTFDGLFNVRALLSYSFR